MSSNDEFGFDLTTGKGRTVIRLRGEIDLANADDLAKALREAADLGEPVVIDVTELAFIDSAGFAAIQRLVERADVHLVVPSECRTARAFAVSGLSEVVPLHRALADVDAPEELG